MEAYQCPEEEEEEVGGDARAWKAVVVEEEEEEEEEVGGDARAWKAVVVEEEEEEDAVGSTQAAARE